MIFCFCTLREYLLSRFILARSFLRQKNGDGLLHIFVKPFDQTTQYEARTQSINDICTHLNDRFGYPEDSLSRCIDWIQEGVTGQYDESQMEAFKTCTLAIETNVSSEIESEIGQCACAVDPDNYFICSE